MQKDTSVMDESVIPLVMAIVVNAFTIAVLVTQQYAPYTGMASNAILVGLSIALFLVGALTTIDLCKAQQENNSRGE